MQKNTHKIWKWWWGITLVWAVAVVILGAYTRLTDAGLGCPDWPGCYGFVGAPETEEQIALAESRFADSPVETQKAWTEMIHRYFAGALGLLIAFGAFFMAKSEVEKRAKTLGWLLVGLVIFQAFLGMLTVTLGLMPQVVMGHLLGGMLTVTALLIMNLILHQRNSFSVVVSTKTFGWWLIATGVLFVQVMLGGWVAANYAALACTKLPICEADWLYAWDWDAFRAPPPVKGDYEFGVFDSSKRITIHAAHRIWAIVTAVVLAFACLQLWKESKQLRFFAGIVKVLLAIQIALGVSNVWFLLPVSVAVAHNLGAVILFSLCASGLYRLFQSNNSRTYSSRGKSDPSEEEL